MSNKGSDDGSVEDQVVGNVSKYPVLPPSYTDKPRRGHLIFDACFESGNLGRVDYINEFEYDLFIRPDTCNPRFRVWFNFTVENVQCDQRVIFNIVNFSKTKSLYREGMSPVIKSSSRPKWQRIPSKHVYYYRCPDHHKNYVMSFAFVFDRESDVYQFAYSFPYSYSRLQSYLENIEKKNLSYVRREVIGSSVQQRRLDILTVSEQSNIESDVSCQRVVFVTARIHPGETPSSYVCQGFIDFIISNHAMAKLLREYLVFKIVPMLNPDGVYLGNYRSSLMGFDLNRHWQEPSPWAHPTLYTMKQLLQSLDNDEKIKLDFYIDIHAHSTMMNGFMYGNIYEDECRFERQSDYPKLLCQNAEDFSLANTSYNKDIMKAGTGRRFLGGFLDEKSHCYTLEVSFFGYMTNNNTQIQPYTEETYISLGKNVARTYVDYYKLRGLIPEHLPVQMSDIGGRSTVAGGGSNNNSKVKRDDRSSFEKAVLDRFNSRITPFSEHRQQRYNRNKDTSRY